MTAEIYHGHPDTRLLKLPNSPPDYDPVAKTLYGCPVELEDLDTACFSHYDTLVAVVTGMKAVEACEDQVDGFKQVGRQILVCGKGESHTKILKVCWECRWLSKAHRPDCPWKLVRDVCDL